MAVIGVVQSFQRQVGPPAERLVVAARSHTPPEQHGPKHRPASPTISRLVSGESHEFGLGVVCRVTEFMSKLLIMPESQSQKFRVRADRRGTDVSHAGIGVGWNERVDVDTRAWRQPSNALSVRSHGGFPEWRTESLTIEMPSETDRWSWRRLPNRCWDHPSSIRRVRAAAAAGAGRFSLPLYPL